MSTLVKHTEKINDLEHRLEKQQEKHDEELEKLQLDRKHHEELKNFANDIEKLKRDHASDINILKGIKIIFREIPHIYYNFDKLQTKAYLLTIILKGS